MIRSGRWRRQMRKLSYATRSAFLGAAQLRPTQTSQGCPAPLHDVLF